MSIAPGVDFLCKIKAFCKKAADFILDKAKKLVSKAPTGKAPSINPAKEAEEMAAIKADARTATTAPAPKTPKPPTKDPTPATRGKPGGNGGGGAPRAKDGCAKHSFDPATPVVMADNTSRQGSGKVVICRTSGESEEL
ncbi:hypothetical protein OG470_20325 [Micromonospora sp. NBC_00389]|uniref:hypothetical protein n=1 Tax=Micromonospora sp. NBC_00389 TaxID=2903586 RepID=UPI002E1CD0D2